MTENTVGHVEAGHTDGYPFEQMADAGAGDAVPGERAPEFAADTSTGRTLGLDDFLGKVPVALTFVGTLPSISAEAVIDAYNDVFAEFGRRRVQLLIVTPEDAEAVQARRQGGITVPLLADADGQVLERYASSATFPATVVVDEGGTVSRVLEGGTPHDHVDAVLALSDENGRLSPTAESGEEYAGVRTRID